MAQYLPTHVRLLNRKDERDVLQIDGRSHKPHWRQSDLLWALGSESVVGLVAEHEDRILGFCIYRLLRHRIEIERFAVDVPFRRRRVGMQMLARVCGKAHSGPRDELTMIVRETNLTAQLFLRHCGFRCDGILRREFSDCDGYLMALRSPEEAAGTLAVAAEEGK